ncbi:MAG TPA: hypothetical protein VGU90_02375 [Terriglobales bacterium]|nr:hypothetical protein [Terriglobales bacterium]
MTVYLLLFIVAFVATAVVVLLLRQKPSGNFDQLAEQLLAFDEKAFRNLVDENEELFLREQLSAREFRSIHRERMRAALDYLHGAAHNARILIQLAEGARQSADARMAAAADQLLDNAYRLRVYTLKATPRLYLGILFPGLPQTLSSVIAAHDTMAQQFSLLLCVKASSRIASPSLQNRV